MTRTPAIRVERFSSTREWVALRTASNALAAGVPFRSFEWLESWWRCYGAGPGKELYMLAAFDRHARLVGLAPWYRESGETRRTAIRFLGSGEVCSDYLTVLCARGREEEVTAALADWLCAAADGLDGERNDWDLLELNGVDAGDKTVARFVEHLTVRGKLVHRRARSSCWRVKLPGDWDTYLATLSKSHRKQLRRLERNYFRTSRARLHLANDDEALDRGLQLLVQLHQRRRESLGERGCFSSTQFAAFHVDTAQRLLRSGNLRLVWLEVDGRAVAVEFQVLGDGVVYAYQSGIEPEALEYEPGRLITMVTLKQAILEGRRAFDFLRGDELYKAHWRAQPRPTHDIRVVSDTPGARLRHSLLLAGGNVKRWIQHGLKFSGVATR